METAVFAHDDPAFDDALDIRTRVFVDEQDVPMDREVDGRDPAATHFLVSDPDPVAVARTREYEDGLKVERVAVLADARGEGYGHAVMDAVESYANEEGYDRLVRLSPPGRRRKRVTTWSRRKLYSSTDEH